MKVPKESKGGFSGQMNNAAKDIKTNMGKSKGPSRRSQGMPTVQTKVSDKLSGQPKGKSACGMDNKMLGRLNAGKKGL